MLLFLDGNLVTDAFSLKHFPAFLRGRLCRSEVYQTHRPGHTLGIHFPHLTKIQCRVGREAAEPVGDDQAGQHERKLVVSVMEPLDKKWHNAAMLGLDMVSILHGDHFTLDLLLTQSPVSH